ncbi:MAG: DegV family protein [Clostridia bacterium]|nr:DegV family protein [Clostridia bacterium]
MTIRITSDRTCDLGHLVKERNIGIHPLQVNLGTECYRDGIDITPEEIFAYVEKTKTLPKTSAPSIADYQEFFEEQLKDADAVIHFNISQKSSGSHNMAKQAAEEFNGKVRVIDSMALSSGQGLLVMVAADLRDEGRSVDEIEETVKAVRERINTSFIPDRLDYLYKGGRVSKMAMYGANLLKIHPLIYMENGQLVPGKKYRGKMTVLLKQYVEDLKTQYPNYDKKRCFITHSSADRELVDAVREKVEELFDFDEIIETVAGSIITSHCGKNTIGVLFVYNK